ncbi:MAG: hypothetical protein WBA41_15165 [Rivularia sp. (in: cyanobacteria)]
MVLRSENGRVLQLHTDFVIYPRAIDYQVFSILCINYQLSIINEQLSIVSPCIPPHKFRGVCVVRASCSLVVASEHLARTTNILPTKINLAEY